MHKTPFIAFSLILLLLLPLHGLCAEKCVQVEGEAVIIGSDIPSAKTEAVARAKWAAIEQTVGTEVKAGSIIQDWLCQESFAFFSAVPLRSGLDNLR
jgi:hypothetical protein